MDVVRWILSLIFSIVLIFTVVSFVVVSTVSDVVDEDNYDTLVSDVAYELIESQIAEQSGGAIDADSVHAELLERCFEKETIIIEEIDWEIDCNEVRSSTPGELESSLKSDLAETVRGGLGSQELGEIGVLLNFSKIFLLISGGLSLILMLLLLFLMEPKSYAFLDLGVVGVIAGIPFLFIGFLKTGVLSELQNYEATKEVGEVVLGSMYTNFLTIFIIGIVLLVVGFVWHHAIKNKVKAHKKKKSRKRRKK